MAKLKVLVLFFLLQSVSYLNAADKALHSSEEFLNHAKSLLSKQELWASFKGQALYTERKVPFWPFSTKKRYTVPFSFAIDFSLPQVKLQILGDEKEIHTVTKDKNLSVFSPVDVKSLNPEKLAEMGMRPEDLALDFLNWNFVRELKSESYKFVDCRVFILRCPAPSVNVPQAVKGFLDKKLSQEIEVKVYLAKNYFFPMKVEWYTEAYHEGLKANRKLEASGLVGKNGIGLTSELALSGSGWVTRICFDEDAIKAGSYSEKPKNLFNVF